MFYCFDCHQDDAVATAWLRPRDHVTLREPEAPGKFLRAKIGKRWLVTDYSWEDNLLQGKVAGEKDVIGHSPYLSVTVYGTKIGGHVYWIQGDAMPKCKCKKSMRIIGQFASHDDLQFGDAGIAYLFYCRTGKCGQTKAVEQCF